MPTKYSDDLPKILDLVAVFTGEDPGVEGLIRENWTDRQNDVGVLAARFEAEGNGKFGGALVVALGTTAPQSVLGWLLRNEEWHVFYKSVIPDDYQAPQPAALGLPTGCYVPFGQDRDDKHSNTGQPKLVLDSGEYLPLPPFDCFSHVLTRTKRTAILLGKHGDSEHCDAHVEEADAVPPWPLTLDLHSRSTSQQSMNPAETERRLTDAIKLLKEDLEAHLQWQEQTSDEPIVRMYIYPETKKSRPKSVWWLREWFTRVPAKDLHKFKHARVVVKGLPCPLHLVVPPSSPAPIPPDAEFVLRKDWRWGQKERTVFVPEGMELYPYPPRDQDSSSLLDIMARCLWKDAPATDTLVILRDNSDPSHKLRFTVGQFQPLDRQIESLNTMIAILHAEEVKERNDVFGTLFDNLVNDLPTHLAGHVSRITHVLDGLWTGEREQLSRYRQQVNELLNSVDMIRDWQGRINEFRDADWNTWSMFRRDVLNMDLGIVPQETRLPPLLRKLTDVYSDLASLWLNDTPEERQRLAHALTTLARSISSPPSPSV